MITNQTKSNRSFRPKGWVGHPLGIALVLGFLICFPSPSGCCAQDAPVPEAETTTDSKASFQSLLDEQKENTRKISRLYASMPIGVVRAQIDHRNQINTLQKRNQQIAARLEPTAITELRSSNPPDLQIVNFLMLRVKNKLDGKNPRVPFNPPEAIELLEVLETIEVKLPDLTSYIYYANLLSNRFERARGILDQAVKRGFKVPASTLPQLESFEQQWQPELVRRAAEQTADNLPRVLLETAAGNITVELFEDDAPNTVNNFISLVEAGFYDGLSFHQIDRTFACQTGCPEGDGTGNAGYRIACECNELNARPHFTGSLSMAHSGPNTGSSQFRIAKQPLPRLTGQTTVFGRVIEGMTLIYQMGVEAPLERTQPPSNRILKATVIRKRDHAYVPEKIEDNKPESCD
ncbi:MAG: peptidylprolyl isomerase [Mariniblastus sp.]|nr:peptidylprolyl isomerase [Mariniblastus sp.]